MKKITLLVALFAIFIISCEKDEVGGDFNNQERLNFKINIEEKTRDINSDLTKNCKELQDLSKANLIGNKNSCAITNNPINVQTVTHGSFPSSPCYISDNTPCFSAKLKTYVTSEVWNQTTSNSIVKPASVTYVTSGSVFLMFSDVINTDNLYPYISASNANIIYKEVSCQILDYINSLPPLSNQVYDMRITYLSIDFTTCGGPEDTQMQLSYDIRKW